MHETDWINGIKLWFCRNWRQLLGACIMWFAAARLPELCMGSSDLQEQIAFDVLTCLFWFAFLVYLVWWLLDSRKHTDKASEN